MSRTVIAVKSAFFDILMPGTVTVLVPWLLIRHQQGGFAWDGSMSEVAGIGMIATGAAAGLWCAGLFAFIGKGTPAPIDPPKELVVSGAYRFVRNPMYIAVAAIVFGEALFFWAPALLIYAAALCAAFHTFVVVYEEPVLRKKFGASYEGYCHTVSRWRPRLPE